MHDRETPRTIVLADRQVGLTLARWLLGRDDAHIVLGVVDPDTDDALRRLYVEHDIATCSSDKLNATISGTRAVDLLLCLWWPRVVPQAVVAKVDRAINIHPSLLPLHRGKHPNFWTIAQRTVAGVTIHEIGTRVDSGPIILQREIGYDWTDTGGTLYERLLDASIATFKDAWPLIVSGRRGTPQTGVACTHRAADLERAKQIHLDRPYTARELLDLLRAATFPPHPSCWFEDDGRRFSVHISISEDSAL